MDDLTFSSERSEFATDGPVSIKSEQGQLEGTGLILLFDVVPGQIDFMNIRDLEELRVYGRAETSPQAESTDETLTEQQLETERVAPSAQVAQVQSPAPAATASEARASAERTVSINTRRVSSVSG